MTVDARPAEVVGNPVRRDLLLRALRSNTNATILAGWTALLTVIGTIVLINQLGLTRPFATGARAAEPVGRAVAQWWVVTITVGMCLFAPTTTVVACASQGERQRLQGWTMTLVRPWRVVTGIWQQQCALIALALVLALPVAGMALAAGGTSVAQLGVGLAGAALAGVATSALAAAVACRSDHVLRPLAATLAIVIALYAVPFAVHQSRTPATADPVLLAVPVVAVADAAAPRASGAPTVAGAADAPLDHLAMNVADGPADLPPWSSAAAGAVLATLLLLVVARFRIARPPRH